MPEDASLDDFATGSSDDPATDDGDGNERADADGPPAADVAPATVTADWSPGGAPCDRCGASVERRWVGADGRVCADCTEW